MGLKSQNVLYQQRYRLLIRLERMLELPMIILGVLWLVILVVELTIGLSKELELVSLIVWIIFVIDFFIKLLIAPKKILFFKKSWLTVVSLFLPALRIFRVAKILRFSRGLKLIKVLSTANRGLSTLQNTLRRRGFIYVVLLSFIILILGSAGIYTLEKSEGYIKDYGTALWWTSMVLTTMGSEYWPKTPEGRTLCVFLSLYSFTTFGYVTASLATFFIGQDQKDNEKLTLQIAELKETVKQLNDKLK